LICQKNPDITAGDSGFFIERFCNFYLFAPYGRSRRNIHKEVIMTNQYHRLYRSQTNKVLAGVCGGLAEYLNADPTVIRLVWILLTFLGGSGIVLYILAIFIIPENVITASSSTSPPVKSDFTAGRIFGILFVIAGIIILLDNLEIFSFCRIWDMSWEFVFPGILILAGIYLLTKRTRRTENQSNSDLPHGYEQPLENQSPSSESPKESSTNPKVFRRSTTDKKIFGICGGAGEFFGIDPTIVRIAYAIFTVLSSGMGIILYFLMYLIVPEDKHQQAKQ
jgi:phage shock protein C